MPPAVYSSRPPRVAAWLLARYFARRDRVELTNELAELFDARRQACGDFRARVWYWTQLLSFPIHQWRERFRGHSGPEFAPSGPPPNHGRGTGGHRSAMFGAIIQDVRYAGRRLRQSPGFTAIAITIMGLGIGANTAIFSIVNAVLFKPLPYENPSELVRIFTTEDDGEMPMVSSYPDFVDFRDREDLFSGAVAHTAMIVSLLNDDGAETVFVEYVSAAFFELLGLPPAMGRAFDSREDELGASEPVAIVGYQAWQRRYGGDPNIVGTTVRLNGHPITIVGVGPEDFSGSMLGFTMEFWLPWGTATLIDADIRRMVQSRGSHSLSVTARLQPGVTVAQASTAMELLGHQLAEKYPDTNTDRNVITMAASDVRLHPFIDAVLYPVASLLMAMVGLVLLVACSNLANLLLVRASSRSREVAVRLALGATRRRLVSQLLAESTLLGVFGGAVGLVLAYWTANFITSFQPPVGFPIAVDLTLDGTVLGFTVVLSIATGVIFGLVPSLRASRPDVVSTLKDETRSLGRARRRFGLTNVLVVSQVGVSLILLIAAGLFLRGLITAQHVDPGFETTNAAVATVGNMSGLGEGGEREFLRQLARRLEAHPDVRAVALADRVPLAASLQTRGVVVDGYELPPGVDALDTDYTAVTPEFFDVMGIPVFRGRAFTARDTETSPNVAIVSAAMARQIWGTEEVIGRRFRWEASEVIVEVVGVARDIKVRTLGEAPRRMVYVPFDQAGGNLLFVSAIAATSGDPSAMPEVFRREVKALNSSVPLFEAKTMQQHLGIILFAPRMAAFLLAGFGILALALATIGLYGVVAYSVAQRTREVGIRVALGADRGRVVSMVIREGMTMVGVGVVVGLVLSTLAMRPLAGVLHGVSAADPMTYAGVAIVLTVVALLASYIPARRASRVDPMVALRYE
jgi:putative ABC transport system permease protein